VSGPLRPSRSAKSASAWGPHPYPVRMLLFDTLTNTKRELELREPAKVSMYACGPTVYDAPHLGHARNALTYDLLRRYLVWRGLDVHHVSNVTDIDDNIINRAKREGRTEPEVAAQWEGAYIEAMDAIGILHPHDRPRATAFVEQMVDFIADLMNKGVAYQTDSGVYLSVASVPDYGGLVHRTPDDLRESAGARVDVDEAKADPLDFVLWKRAKPGEPTWPAPWGDGRPGWHIECVAMSLAMNGPDFDIHGGGDDLAFPHHENERAEATAGGHLFARHWVHHAMVNVSGEKMSKSLGNFTTVTALLEHHDGRALRLLMLQTHYRKTMEVNAAAMAQAEAALERLDALGRRALAAGVQSDPGGRDSASTADFTAAMEDDMGTPNALATIFDVVRRANAALDAGDAGAAGLIATVDELAGVLGLDLVADAEDGGDPEIDALVAQRTDARASKDFTAADEIRDGLQEMGIEVEDTPTGPIWRRV
jgi:cysteinyl-tRNA synthetase